MAMNKDCIKFRSAPASIITSGLNNDLDVLIESQLAIIMIWLFSHFYLVICIKDQISKALLINFLPYEHGLRPFFSTVSRRSFHLFQHFNVLSMWSSLTDKHSTSVISMLLFMILSHVLQRPRIDWTYRVVGGQSLKVG